MVSKSESRKCRGCNGVFFNQCRADSMTEVIERDDRGRSIMMKTEVTRRMGRCLSRFLGRALTKPKAVRQCDTSHCTNEAEQQHTHPVIIQQLFSSLWRMQTERIPADLFYDFANGYLSVFGTCGGMRHS